MDKVEDPLRFVKYTMKYPSKKRSQIMIVMTCMDMPLKTLFKIMKIIIKEYLEAMRNCWGVP